MPALRRAAPPLHLEEETRPSADFCGLEKAVERGADAFLTADVRYDRFFAAEKRTLLADIGHFESEIVAIPLLFEILTKKFPTFALHKSEGQHNPVNYL